MSTETKKTYPMLAAKSWWAIRNKFQQSIPPKVTPSYLSPVLGMTEKSAQNNVLPFLRIMGIIDEDSKPTDLANKWRFDDNYKEFCELIKTKIYPQELLDAIPDASDRASLQRWFASNTGAGEVAARRMATFYALLAEADPSKGDTSIKRKTNSKPKTSSRKVTKQKSKSSEIENKNALPTYSNTKQVGFPSLHIDIQIHVSPDAPPEQIDQIFASMSKHLKDLYKQQTENN